MPSSPSCRSRSRRAASDTARLRECRPRASRSPAAGRRSARTTRMFSTAPPRHRVLVQSTQTTPPYAAYAGIMSAFVGGLAAAGGLARLLDRDAREQSTLDLAVLGLATFKAARTVSRDEVTSFIREPFVEGQAKEGDESP